MFDTPRGRVAAVVALLCVLFALCVAYGAVAPNPALGSYPDHEDFGANPGPYVGQQVKVSGIVVSTDPVVVSSYVAAGDHRRFEVVGAAEPAAVGDNYRAFGVLEDETTVRAERAVVVEPWETYYTYAVSFVAGLWVLGRIVRDWRLDRRTLGVEPRGTAPTERRTGAAGPSADRTGGRRRA